MDLTGWCALFLGIMSALAAFVTECTFEQAAGT